jgi:hypothetical protein
MNGGKKSFLLETERERERYPMYCLTVMSELPSNVTLLLYTILEK